MVENRVIPCLLLKDKSLVKTIKFGKYTYIGDPLNTCRIFNELEVDEMMILDIDATREKKKPDFEFLNMLTNECFMPLSYGGGITCLEDAKRLFKIGFEKVIINTALYHNLNLINDIADIYGTQSIIASVDVKKDFFGRYKVYSHCGKKEESVNLFAWLRTLEKAGAGEVMLTNITYEGTWQGFDIELIRKASSELRIPLIVHGGAGQDKDIEDAVNIGKASAVALGSMVVFQKKDMGVLINYKHNYNFIQ
jgi:cyclase